MLKGDNKGNIRINNQIRLRLRSSLNIGDEESKEIIDSFYKEI